MRPHIRKIWPLIDGGFQDPVPLVQNATCVAFGCLTEWLTEECAERHEVIMPVSGIAEFSGLVTLISTPIPRR